jgi:hypothetical protein
VDPSPSYFSSCSDLAAAAEDDIFINARRWKGLQTKETSEVEDERIYLSHDIHFEKINSLHTIYTQIDLGAMIRRVQCIPPKKRAMDFDRAEDVHETNHDHYFRSFYFFNRFNPPYLIGVF